MEKTDKCTSCGKGLLEKGYTTFCCPTCETILGRCDTCREQSVNYVCPKCGFTAP